MATFKKIIFKILLHFKFKKAKFKQEGLNCNYKFLNSYFHYPENIKLGNNIWIGPGADFDGAGEIEIGNGTIIAPEVIIYSRTHNFNEDIKALPFDNIVLTAKVTIGEYVWIGRRVLILPGVKIGKGAVIGACSVVSKNVPDYAVVVGNPAKIVNYRDKDIFKQLLAEDEPFVYNKFGHSKIARDR